MRLISKQTFLGASILLAITIMSVGFIVVQASPHNVWLEAISSRAQNDNDVVATINGEPVTEYQLRTSTAAMQQNQGRLTPSEARALAFKSLARQIVQEQEAKRRNLIPTETEARAFMERERAAIETNKSAIAANPGYSLDEVIRASGLSEDQWWASRIPMYANAIGVGRLK